MRPLLVGEASPHGLGPLWVEPLNSAGDRLRRILGLSVEEYLARFDRANLFETPPARWSAEEARGAAARLARRAGGRPVVLLGRKVADAFAAGQGYFEVVGKVLVLPHPSGRVWNDPAAHVAARRAVKLLVRRP